MLGPQLVELFEDGLGGVALLEEVTRGRLRGFIIKHHETSESMAFPVSFLCLALVVSSQDKSSQLLF